MGENGSCHCGAISYKISDGAQPVYHAICHCSDCRRATGAPAVSWSLFGKDEVEISGYASSEHGERQFCGQCGTSLFYLNEQVFPGKIDVQSATLDNPEAFPLGAQVQTAERLGYMEHLSEIAEFERYPGMG